MSKTTIRAVADRQRPEYTVNVTAWKDSNIPFPAVVLHQVVKDDSGEVRDSIIVIPVSMLTTFGKALNAAAHEALALGGPVIVRPGR